MPGSPLEKAIEDGMRPGANLADALHELGDIKIRTRSDAQAICRALARFPMPRAEGPASSFRSPLRALAELLQEVDSREAFEVFREEGTAQLVRITDALLASPTEEELDDLLFILKILAGYRTREGAEWVVRAALKPLKPDSWWWEPVFSAFAEGHPERERVFGSFRDRLPEGFIAVALLDAANQAAIDHELRQHPFDSPAGKQRLREWFTDAAPEHFSYARSATTALPFISGPERSQLLALAMEHADADVQVEAGWAAAKLGSEAGIELLARHCLDVSRSRTAQHYLKELKREKAVPREARDPDFQAKAEFAAWLAHPNELGRPPDELAIVDRRWLAWPPERDTKPFWLIKYVARDTTGLEDDDTNIGLVGSTTFCFFSHEMPQRPPEDAYALHCYWEMEHAELIREAEVNDPAEYAGMLRQWKGPELRNAEVLCVAELSPRLKHPQKLVALASATLGGEEGWAVLDGSRSTWYPKADQPKGAYEKDVLEIHVGRQLLGFSGQPDRRKHLAKEQLKREPQQIVAAYERLLAEAKTGPERRRKELFTDYGSPLGKHFIAYVEARASVTGVPSAQTLIQVYDALLDTVRANTGLLGADAYISPASPLAIGFDAYVDALVEMGQAPRIPPLIASFAPYWDHPSGYGMLGTAAYKAGDAEAAERFFVKLHGRGPQWFRFGEMGLLARIWHAKGRAEDAHQLLVGCLKQTLAQSRSAHRTERKRYEEEFQAHRKTYLDLFPDRGDAYLAKQGVPNTTLPAASDAREAGRQGVEGAD
ncbi:MAG: hypothetical protein FJ291_09460 [Planctomycetes bacterium]|nr:hypothetical protein [Planctomycetota bacterium]